MGGDEFCALFDPREQVVNPTVAGAASALSEQGEGFEISCSHGSVLLPLEVTSASDALRIADQRMYAQKNAGRASASRQSKDVLVRALAERNLELSSHAMDVASLCERTARRLALPVDLIDRIRQAAELHDIGKIAVRERDPQQARRLREVRDCAGTQFDPVVVEAFCAVWAEYEVRITAAAAAR